MTTAEFNEMMRVLRAAYPAFDVRPWTRDVYRERLGEEDGPLMLTAARWWIDHSRWFPSVAELLEARAEVRVRPRPRPAPDPELVQHDDATLTASWRAAGMERRMDGRLYSIATGRQVPVQPPENVLPPLPDGSRPERPAAGPLTFQAKRL